MEPSKSKSKEWLDIATKNGYIKSIPYTDFEQVQFVDGGGYGQVFKGFWPSAQRNVALKYINEELHSNNNNGWKAFVRELQHMHSVDHNKNIIRFFGISHDKRSDTDRYYLIMEYANDGTLRRYLANNRSITWDQRINIAKEIASGLYCIHHHNIWHRDLHSKNVLVHHGHMKIADYGLGQSLDDIMSNSMQGGIAAYTDPKYLEDEKFIRKEPSDIYAYGVLLWEISSGKPPFMNENAHYVSNAVKNGKREEPVPLTPAKYTHLYQSCWQQDPNKRPTIREVMNKLNEIFFIPEVMNKLNEICFIPEVKIHPAPDLHQDPNHTIQISNGFLRPNIISTELTGNLFEPDKCKNICIKYKQIFRKSSVPSTCSPTYHASLGDQPGLRWHLNEEKDLKQFENSLFLVAAQNCPPQDIIPIFEVLISFGMNIQTQLDERGNTALHWVMENKAILESFSAEKTQVELAKSTDDFSNLIKWLIAHGVKINIKNNQGRTAISWLVNQHQPEAVKVFLKFNPDLELADETGFTVLQRVLNFEYKQTNKLFNKKNVKIVKLLLEKDAYPNLPTNPPHKTSSKSFPNSLFLAIYRGWPVEILQLLIDNGASPTELHLGKNALAYAVNRRNFQVVKFFLENIEQLRDPKSIAAAVDETFTIEKTRIIEEFRNLLLIFNN
ncbi:hypothetical protein G9A89_020869 [Geosiphon pyriformis]|nr:hypothetical protein G9A89_020869 [Geosiphon pyriformis]